MSNSPNAQRITSSDKSVTITNPQGDIYDISAPVLVGTATLVFPPSAGQVAVRPLSSGGFSYVDATNVGKIGAGGTVGASVTMNTAGFTIVLAQLVVSNGAGTQYFSANASTSQVLPAGTTQVVFDTDAGHTGTDLTLGGNVITSAAGGVFTASLYLRFASS